MVIDQEERAMWRLFGDYTLGVVIVIMHLMRISIGGKYGALPR